MFLVLLLQLLLLALPCAGRTDSGTDARLRNLSLAAKADQQRGDYRSAAASYEQILKLRPNLAEAWANLGLMYQFLGEYRQADKDFQVALGKNPQLYVPNLFLGLNSLRAHQPQNALHYLKQAEVLNPGDGQAALALARVHQSLHHDTEASAWFDRAIEINPQNPDAWYGLGVTYLSIQDSAVVQLRKLSQSSVYARALLAEAFLQQGRTNDAIKIYNQLLDSPTQPPCLLAALGFAYAQAGSLSQAQVTLQDELKRNPGCLPARLGLASVAITKGDSAEAFRELRTAWNADRNFLRSNVEQTWSGLGPGQLHKLDTWLRQNSPPLTQDGFTKLLVASIESRSVNRTRARDASERPANQGSSQRREFGKPGDPAVASPEVLWAAGHYTACETLLQRLRGPLSSARYLLLAPCSYYAGDYKTSLLASQSALKSDPRSMPGLYWKAKSAQQLAKKALMQTGILAPDSSRVHLLLAELYREREQSRAAEAEYTKVIDSQPAASAAHLGLANVYYQELQFEQALAQLKTVLQEEPANPEASFLMGQILVKRRQYAEAIPSLKVALTGAPLVVPQVHSLLSRCYAAQGQYAHALAELKPALPTDTDGVFHYQLFQLYRKMGQPNAAAAALQQSERLRKEEVEQTQKLIDGAGANH